VAGPAGATGATGPAGKIELVTCTYRSPYGVYNKKAIYEKCTTKLASSTLKFVVTVKPPPGITDATVSRRGQTMATGVLRHGKLVLRSSKPLPAGRYRLTLTTTTGNHTRTTHTTITLTR
jgi:hypothetical protein